MLNQNTQTELSTNYIGLCSQVVQEKWNMLILSQLINEPKRYSQIENEINFNNKQGKISPKILSRRLKQLCEKKIITKERFSTIPPSVQYQLTEIGALYIPVLEVMSEVGKTLPMPDSIKDEFELGLDN